MDAQVPPDVFLEFKGVHMKKWLKLAVGAAMLTAVSVNAQNAEGVAAVVNDKVHLDGRVGGASPGRKVATLVASMLAGGTHIDHADKLRAGATGKVLPFRVMAPSTLGTFLRAFTFGHVRQLGAVAAGFLTALTHLVLTQET